MKTWYTRILLLLFASIFIISCGGGGGAPSPSLPAPGEGEGTEAAPILIVEGSPRVGSIGMLGFSYYKFIPTVTGTYTISLTNTTLEVDWDLYTSFSSYAIDWCSSPTAGSNISCTTPTLTAGQTYYLEVSSWSASAGNYTVTVTAPVPPAAPANVQATAGSYSVSLSWNAVPGASYYNIYWSTSSGMGTSGTKISSNIYSTSYTHTGRTAGTTYYYVITAQNADAVSPPSSQVSATPLAIQPPASVTATALYSQVSLTWSSVTGATKYNIYYNTTPNIAVNGGTKISNIYGTTHNVTSLTTGSTYYFVVTSADSTHESGPSTEVSAVPLTPLPPLSVYNFDDGTLQGWTVSGSWGLTTTYSNSSSYSVTDSPSGNYSNSVTSYLTSPVMDLTSTTSPMLSFFHRYSTESCCDKGYIQISTDGGTIFTNITPPTSGYYSGSLSSFTQVNIDISAYKSSTTVIRFRFVTDGSVTYDGWYIDDITITP